MGINPKQLANSAVDRLIDIYFQKGPDELPPLENISTLLMRWYSISPADAEKVFDEMIESRTTDLRDMEYDVKRNGQYTPEELGAVFKKEGPSLKELFSPEYASILGLYIGYSTESGDWITIPWMVDKSKEKTLEDMTEQGIFTKKTDGYMITAEARQRIAKLCGLDAR
ncbi:MAG: hypothetical protein ABIH34_07800 [Nanoarchaeota archaeon]